jgi:hypothetical protein
MFTPTTRYTQSLALICRVKMKFVKHFQVVLALCAVANGLIAQTVPSDTVSKFDKFNAKMERAFKILPAPIITYSTEAGNTFGLAKFNVFNLSKKDTISRPSKLSEVVTFSTKGRINISISNDLIFNEDKWMILSFLNYKKTPEYILGIGNDVSRDDVEEVTIDRFRFSTTILRRVAKHYYAGISLDLSDYFKIQTDSNSFLVRDGVTGLQGGTDVGVGFSAALDSRDNRYNASNGAFLLTTAVFYPKGLGSRYDFVNVYIDGRKYFNPWFKHVIAVQATTMYSSGDVPFYDLSMMGGEDRMRGYYKGAIRDKVLVDAQIEYRMPIWNIFGITTWVGTGRVMDKYSNFNFDGLWLSYGGGIRIRVDSKNNTNLRFDMGFGPNGVSGFYFNFAEAF